MQAEADSSLHTQYLSNQLNFWIMLQFPNWCSGSKNFWNMNTFVNVQIHRIPQSNEREGLNKDTFYSNV